MAVGRKTNLKRLVLAGAGLVPVVAAFVAFWETYVLPRRPDTFATAEQLQNAVVHEKQTAYYKIGGEYVARLEGSGVAFDPDRLRDNQYQKFMIIERVLVDFVSTVTPRQTEIMKKERGLRFAALSPDQQRLLSRLHWYAQDDIDDVRRSDWVLFLMREPRGDIYMLWKGTRRDGSHTSDKFGITNSYRGRHPTKPDPSSRDVVDDICRGIPRVVEIDEASPSGVSEQRLRGAHPVVDANGFLVGGTVNGRWVSAREMAAHIRGGELYRTYRDGCCCGTAVGSKPNRNLAVRFQPDAGGTLALVAAWNAAPRKPAKVARYSKDDIDAVKRILKENGLPRSPVRIVEAIRVDIDGDGHPETLITAASMDPSSYEVGDYSLVALRKVTQGKPETSLAVGDFHEKESASRVPRYYRVGYTLDLDGDGTLEVVVNSASPSLESYGTEVYKLEGGKLHLVAAVRPNYDYRIR